LSFWRLRVVELSVKFSQFGDGVFLWPVNIVFSVGCLKSRSLDRWESAAFSSIFLTSSLYCSQAESTPAPAPVTQTVGRLPEVMS